MVIVRFEDLIAWQKAQDIAIEIYQNFGLLKDFAFKDQLFRASISISNNIAEGFDRNSRPDFSRFLYFALSSCSEVKSMLYLAFRLGYISQMKQERLLERANEVSRIIRGLHKSLKEK